MTAVCQRNGCGHYAALHDGKSCLAGSHGDDEDDACPCWGWMP